MVPLGTRYHNSAHFILSCSCQYVKEDFLYFLKMIFYTFLPVSPLFIMHKLSCIFPCLCDKIDNIIIGQKSREENLL